MSSAASTDAVRADSGRRTDQGFQPWQFFVLAALGCATAVTFVVRGQGVLPVVLLSILMGATALAGLAVLRTVRPLVSAHHDRTRMIGQRTRVALEREKMLALRAIKELEFDRAMGKVSDDDFREMAGRLRTRAARLMRQVDASTGYRELIERDLAKRLGEKTDSRAPDPGDQASGVKADASGPPDTARECVQCSTTNDVDARFCKGCGTKL